MSDDMYLETDEASQFTGNLKNPGQCGPAPAQSCSGLMAECTPFRTALDEFLKAAVDFVGQVDRGVNGYRDIVTACVADYSDTDHSKAQRIAQTMQLEPGDLADNLRSRGNRT